MKAATLTSPETPGEELYLVHLARRDGAPSEDDYDHLTRKRTHSVGEELWEIHLKRSQGVEPDFDVPVPADNSAVKTKKGRKKSAEQQHHEMRYNLRSRRVISAS